VVGSDKPHQSFWDEQLIEDILITSLKHRANRCVKLSVLDAGAKWILPSIEKHMVAPVTLDVRMKIEKSASICL
jgi:hypothetical protein